MVGRAHQLTRIIFYNMKTYRIYTPWNSIVIEAKNEKQAKIDAVKQLLYEIESDAGASLDAEEIEAESLIDSLV
jgi:hypothetical protein